MNGYMENISNCVEYHVIFEVLKIEQELEQGSTIQIGERFVGLYYPDTEEIHFTDDNSQEVPVKQKT